MPPQNHPGAAVIAPAAAFTLPAAVPPLPERLSENKFNGQLNEQVILQALCARLSGALSSSQLLLKGADLDRFLPASIPNLAGEFSLEPLADISSAMRTLDHAQHWIGPQNGIFRLPETQSLEPLPTPIAQDRIAITTYVTFVQALCQFAETRDQKLLQERFAPLIAHPDDGSNISVAQMIVRATASVLARLSERTGKLDVFDRMLTADASIRAFGCSLAHRFAIETSRYGKNVYSSSMELQIRYARCKLAGVLEDRLRREEQPSLYHDLRGALGELRPESLGVIEKLVKEWINDAQLLSSSIPEFFAPHSPPMYLSPGMGRDTESALLRCLGNHDDEQVRVLAIRAIRQVSTEDEEWANERMRRRASHPEAPAIERTMDY